MLNNIPKISRSSLEKAVIVRNPHLYWVGKDADSAIVKQIAEEFVSKKGKEIKKLKDRIAELEKENETKTDTITDLLKKQEFYEKEKLKQFAERLIEKAKKGNYIDKRSHANLTDFIIDIDETLKEFIK